jgi:hypothetical protein
VAGEVSVLSGPGPAGVSDPQAANNSGAQMPQNTARRKLSELTAAVWGEVCAGTTASKHPLAANGIFLALEVAPPPVASTPIWDAASQQRVRETFRLQIRKVLGALLLQLRDNIAPIVGTKIAIQSGSCGSPAFSSPDPLRNVQRGDAVPFPLPITASPSLPNSSRTIAPEQTRPLRFGPGLSTPQVKAMRLGAAECVRRRA